MTKQPPAVIIIARHGSRLDAADKHWHRTSPTPYDPPITYGGWLQSRALGQRIAFLLDSREQVPNVESKTSDPSSTASKHKRKKYKITIHTSPFLRCVQTSVGISAGLAQYQSPSTDKSRNDSRARSPAGTTSFQSGPRLHSVNDPRSAREQLRRQMKEQASGPTKTTLRIDAFLGEWLSPDYFDMITPPPNSTMMVAGAKADLLRKGDEIDQYSLSPNPQSSRAASGNLWGNNNASAVVSPDPSSSSSTTFSPKDAQRDGQLDSKSVPQTLPTRRERAWSSAASPSSARSSSFGRQASSPLNPDPVKAYAPPTPHYAIAAVEPIPKGYVAHARDACVEPDYQWDSMREPLLWGDGGNYGEEWSSMHKRFRRGLTSMVNYYKQSGDSAVEEAVTQGNTDSEVDDQDVENVVVLVTHGAGCNALIGALTDQPVLIDVGMASLTMAVRKGSSAAEPLVSPKLNADNIPSDIEKGIHASTTGLSSIYEMKFVASFDHLRPGTDPSRAISQGSNSPILPASKTIPDSRRRSTFVSHAAAGSPMDSSWIIPSLEPGRGNMSAALGSMRRPSQATVQTTGIFRNNSVGSTASSTGLWTPSTPPLIEVDRESAPTSEPAQPKKDSISSDILELSPEAERLAATGRDNKVGVETGDQKKAPIAPTSVSASTDGAAENDVVPDLPQAPPPQITRHLSQRGLWGSMPSGTHPTKERGPKRRWTMQQD